ncbi:MAG TPA: hypothetical protein VG125_10890 [Pirellulales bacterium]|jgi:hypothetical protein|nr:hypothetical protein [Pirellulales bacterium]
MPRVATRHAHQLAYRQRFSVGVRMFGCLVLIAGSIVLAAAVAEATKESISKTAWLAVSLGCLLAVSGTTLLCGQRGKLIDREQGTVTRWWGVVRPLWRSTRDMRGYQAIAVESHEVAGLARWRVNLCGAQGERLELFDLASHEAAQAAARGVAAFLSLTILLPGAAADGASVPARPAVAPTEPPAAAQDGWVYRRPGRRAFRFLGVALLSLGGVLLLGVVGSATSGDARWWIWLAIASPLFASGLGLVCGGRKVEINEQTIRVWRAWPLPPAVYDLTAFYAVIVAAAAAVEAADGEPETCLVGLIGPEQLRLELFRSMPRDAARQAATQLAAAAKLPLIDESLPAAQTA